MMSGTSCVKRSIVREPVKCQHPVVDASTVGGLATGLLDYHAAVNLCNTLNGFPAEYAGKAVQDVK